MRILVTGGAGFLGSHLCSHLLASEENEVVCLDNFFTGTHANVEHLRGNPRFEVMRHDVQEKLTMEVDQIYHLACPASPIHYQRNPVRTIRTAVEGTLNMLEVARECNARILIASTSEVYGDPAEHPQREVYWGNVNPVGPRACYDEGKRCAEALATAYVIQYKVEVRIARIFNTYGPHMRVDDGRVVSNFITQAISGKPITIFGEGTQTRSFCYATDLIDGLTRLMGANIIGACPVNLGNPQETTIRDLVELIRRLTVSGSTIERRPLPEDDPARRRPDIGRAQRYLNWEPRVSLEDGLTTTIRYFRGR